MVKVYEAGEVYFDGKTPVPSYDEYIELIEKIEQLSQKMHILESRLDRAKRALCEVSQLSLQDNVDTSRFYDIAHYTITELNKELK